MFGQQQNGMNMGSSGQSDFSPYLQQAQQVYQGLGGKYTPQNVVSLATSLQGQGGQSGIAKNAAANLAAAQGIVKQLQGAYYSLSPSSGPLALLTGKVKEISGNLNLDPKAKAYKDMRMSYVGLLIKALGHSGALSEGDIQRMGGLIPTLTDSKEVADQKFNSLLSALESTQQNLSQLGGGSTDTGTINPYAQEQGFDTSMFGY